MDRYRWGFMDRYRSGFKHSEHAPGVFEGPAAFLGDGFGFFPLDPGYNDLQPELVQLFSESANGRNRTGFMVPGHVARDTGVRSAGGVEVGSSSEEAFDGNGPSPVARAGGAGDLAGLEPAAQR